METPGTSSSPRARRRELGDPESQEPDAPAPPQRSGPFTLGPRQRTVLISWTSFTVTFALVRALTYAIKNDLLPLRNLHVGGVHLHHYLWGIQLLAASGGVAIYGTDRLRAHPAVVAAYAAGFALVIDEFALLVNLKDVYWTKKGRSSILLGLGLIGVEGGLLACIPAWRLRRATRQARDGAGRFGSTPRGTV